MTDQKRMIDIAIKRLNHVPYVSTNGKKMAVWSSIKEILLWCPSPGCNTVLNALKCLLGYPECEAYMHPCSQREQLLYLRQFMMVSHGTLLVDVDSLQDLSTLTILHDMVKHNHAKSKTSEVLNCSEMLKQIITKYTNTSFKIPVDAMTKKHFLPAVRRVGMDKKSSISDVDIGASDASLGVQEVPMVSEVQTTGQTLVALSLLADKYPSSERFLQEISHLYLLGRCRENDLASMCQCTVEEGIQLTRFLAAQHGYEKPWTCLTSHSVLISWTEFWTGCGRLWGACIDLTTTDVCVVTLSCETRNRGAATTSTKIAKSRRTDTKPISSQLSPPLSDVFDISENVHEKMKESLVSLFQVIETSEDSQTELQHVESMEDIEISDFDEVLNREEKCVRQDECDKVLVRETVSRVLDSYDTTENACNILDKLNLINPEDCSNSHENNEIQKPVKKRNKSKKGITYSRTKDGSNGLNVVELYDMTNNGSDIQKELFTSEHDHDTAKGCNRLAKISVDRSLKDRLRISTKQKSVQAAQAKTGFNRIRTQKAADYSINQVIDNSNNCALIDSVNSELDTENVYSTIQVVIRPKKTFDECCRASHIKHEKKRKDNGTISESGRQVINIPVVQLKENQHVRIASKNPNTVQNRYSSLSMGKTGQQTVSDCLNSYDLDKKPFIIANEADTNNLEHNEFSIPGPLSKSNDLNVVQKQVQLTPETSVTLEVVNPQSNQVSQRPVSIDDFGFMEQGKIVKNEKVGRQARVNGQGRLIKSADADQKRTRPSSNYRPKSSIYSYPQGRFNSKGLHCKNKLYASLLRECAYQGKNNGSPSSYFREFQNDRRSSSAAGCLDKVQSYGSSSSSSPDVYDEFARKSKYKPLRLDSPQMKPNRTKHLNRPNTTTLCHSPARNRSPVVERFSKLGEHNHHSVSYTRESDNIQDHQILLNMNAKHVYQHGSITECRNKSATNTFISSSHVGEVQSPTTMVGECVKLERRKKYEKTEGVRSFYPELYSFSKGVKLTKSTEVLKLASNDSVNSCLKPIHSGSSNFHESNNFAVKSASQQQEDSKDTYAPGSKYTLLEKMSSFAKNFGTSIDFDSLKSNESVIGVHLVTCESQKRAESSKVDTGKTLAEKSLCLLPDSEHALSQMNAQLITQDDRKMSQDYKLDQATGMMTDHREDECKEQRLVQDAALELHNLTLSSRASQSMCRTQTNKDANAQLSSFVKMNSESENKTTHENASFIPSFGISTVDKTPDLKKSFIQFIEEKRAAKKKTEQDVANKQKMWASANLKEPNITMGVKELFSKQNQNAKQPYICIKMLSDGSLNRQRQLEQTPSVFEDRQNRSKSANVKKTRYDIKDRLYQKTSGQVETENSSGTVHYKKSAKVEQTRYKVKDRLHQKTSGQVETENSSGTVQQGYKSTQYEEKHLITNRFKRQPSTVNCSKNVLTALQCLSVEEPQENSKITNYANKEARQRKLRKCIKQNILHGSLSNSLYSAKQNMKLKNIKQIDNTSEVKASGLNNDDELKPKNPDKLNTKCYVNLERIDQYLKTDSNEEINDWKVKNDRSIIGEVSIKSNTDIVETEGIALNDLTESGSYKEIDSLTLENKQQFIVGSEINLNNDFEEKATEVDDSLDYAQWTFKTQRQRAELEDTSSSGIENLTCLKTTNKFCFSDIPVESECDVENTSVVTDDKKPKEIVYYHQILHEQDFSDRSFSAVTEHYTEGTELNSYSQNPKHHTCMSADTGGTDPEDFRLIMANKNHTQTDFKNINVESDQFQDYYGNENDFEPTYYAFKSENDLSSNFPEKEIAVKEVNGDLGFGVGNVEDNLLEFNSILKNTIRTNPDFSNLQQSKQLIDKYFIDGVKRVASNEHYTIISDKTDYAETRRSALLLGDRNYIDIEENNTNNYHHIATRKNIPIEALSGDNEFSHNQPEKHYSYLQCGDLNVKNVCCDSMFNDHLEDWDCSYYDQEDVEMELPEMSAEADDVYSLDEKVFLDEADLGQEICIGNNGNEIDEELSQYSTGDFETVFDTVRTYHDTFKEKERSACTNQTNKMKDKFLSQDYGAVEKSTMTNPIEDIQCYTTDHARRSAVDGQKIIQLKERRSKTKADVEVPRTNGENKDISQSDTDKKKTPQEKEHELKIQSRLLTAPVQETKDRSIQHNQAEENMHVGKENKLDKKDETFLQTKDKQRFEINSESKETLEKKTDYNFSDVFEDEEVEAPSDSNDKDYNPEDDMSDSEDTISDTKDGDDYANALVRKDKKNVGCKSSANKSKYTVDSKDKVKALDNFRCHKKFGSKLEKIRKKFQKKFLKNPSTPRKKEIQSESSRMKKLVGKEEKSIVREYCLNKLQETMENADKFKKDRLDKKETGCEHLINVHSHSEKPANASCSSSYTSLYSKSQLGLKTAIMLKRRNKKKCKQVIAKQPTHEEKQTVDNLAAEGFIKKQKLYYEILKRSSSLERNSDNIGIHEESETCVSHYKVEVSDEGQGLEELSEVIEAVSVHGERPITKAISDAEKALEGTGSLDDLLEDQSDVIEDTNNQCRYQMIEDEDHIQLGGIAYFKDYSLPFIYINGYKYTPQRDVLQMFTPECCPGKCTLPRKVLQNHKKLIKTFSTWEQVYKLELIKMKNGPAVMTGDLLLKLDNVISCLPQLIQEIVKLHQGSKLKSSQNCNIDGYYSLQSKFK